MLRRAIPLLFALVPMVVQMQSIVSMMMVGCILTMHHQVFQLAYLLGDRRRAEHAQRLP